MDVAEEPTENKWLSVSLCDEASGRVREDDFGLTALSIKPFSIVCGTTQGATALGRGTINYNSGGAV